MATSAIDLSQIPAPTVIEQLDYETIVSEITADITSRGLAADPPINLAPALALESEPLTIALEAFAYRELALRNQFNLRSQANMLPYATGSDLDNLVANFLVQRQTNESDGALLARALLEPAGSSTAGPVEAYQFHALSADPTITDVSVTSPAPCQVQVAVLTTAADGSASPALIAEVQAALNADAVRPMTDQVTVVSAKSEIYNVTAELVLGSGPDQATVIANVQTAVQAYAAAQRKLNRAISLNAVIAALMQAGVVDLTLTSPAAPIAADPQTAPILGVINLTVAAS